jgi:hypothetical protein
LQSVRRELVCFTNYFVIPAQAGTQAVPHRREVRAQRTETETTCALAISLAVSLGTAWVPACAGMTK